MAVDTNTLYGVSGHSREIRIVKSTPVAAKYTTKYTTALTL